MNIIRITVFVVVGFLAVVQSVAEVWLSGERVAEATEPVVAGKWHGGFKQCLAEADRTHKPLIAVFSKAGNDCSFCAGFRNAANTDEFKGWVIAAGCIDLYMETGYDWTAKSGGNGYAVPDSDAWRWVSVAQSGEVSSVTAVKLYWNLDGKTCLSTNFVYHGSSSDTGSRAITMANRFIDQCEAFLSYGASPVNLHTNYYQETVIRPGFCVDEEVVVTHEEVWATGTGDRRATRIRIPRTVDYVCPYAFSDLYYLESVSLPSGLTEIGEGAFRNCTVLDNVIIPDKTEVIGDGAFENCSWMKTITVGSGVKKVRRNAFRGCTQLRTIAFQEGLGEIEAGAFDGCWRLESVVLPASVTNVDETAFAGCSSLTNVVVPTHSGTMSTWFKPVYAQIKTVTIPVGVHVVMPNMFMGCSALEEVIFSAKTYAARTNGVRTIGDCAFKDCESLVALEMPPSVVEMGESTFENCVSLERLSLSWSLIGIPNRAFYGCRSLSTFTVPESVTYLGSEIVSGSSSYWSDDGTKTIYFEGNAPTYAFDVYGAARSDLVSYVVYGTSGWDGRVMSRDIPRQWPTDAVAQRDIQTWSYEPFSVTFDAYGGVFTNDNSQAVTRRQVVNSMYVLPPDNPFRSYYVFNGWWTEPYGGKRVTSLSRVTLMQPHTIYAHWDYAPNRMFTVTFDAMGGDVLRDTCKVREGSPVEDLPTPTRSKYKFAGWYTEETGGVKVTASMNVMADVTYYAHWTFVGTSTVVADVGYNYEGRGTVSGGKTAKAGTKVTLTAKAKSGYVFAGWYLDEYCRDPVDGDVDYRSPSYVYVIGEENVTLYARFVPKADDDVEVWLWADEEYRRGTEIEPLEIDVESESLATVKVSGLPAGLKFTAKAIYAKNGSLVAPVNSIYGTPSKSGIYVVTVTATTVGKKTATDSVKIVVRDLEESIVDVDWDTGRGTVSGCGVCGVGKTLTLKASAKKGYVFAGWYQDAFWDEVWGEGDWYSDILVDFEDPVETDGDYRAPTLVVRGNGEKIKYYARFVKPSDDQDIVLFVDGREITADAADVLFHADEKLPLEVAMTSGSLPTVSMENLPPGLKYTAKLLVTKTTKTVGKKKMTTVTTNALPNTIYGTPTKPGTYVVTAKLSNAAVSAKKPLVRQFTMTVDNFTAANDLVSVYDRDGNPTILANARGEQYEIPVGVKEFDLPTITADGSGTVKVTGLPSGLKYDATTGNVTGVATTAGTYTAFVTVGKAVSTFTVVAKPLPAWAKGTFVGLIRQVDYNGWGEVVWDDEERHDWYDILTTVTVASSGKVTVNAKFPEGETFKLTFSAINSISNGCYVIEGDGVCASDFKLRARYVISPIGMRDDGEVTQGHVSVDMTELATKVGKQWKDVWADDEQCTFSTDDDLPLLQNVWSRDDVGQLPSVAGHARTLSCNGHKLTFAFGNRGVVTVKDKAPNGKTYSASAVLTLREHQDGIWYGEICVNIIYKKNSSGSTAVFDVAIDGDEPIIQPRQDDNYE